MTKKSDNEPIDANQKEDLEKRRPKPFRYISDLSELSANDEQILTSVMNTNSDEMVKKLIEQFDSVVGVGDVNTIERVIQKHEKRNKKLDPSVR